MTLDAIQAAEIAHHKAREVSQEAAILLAATPEAAALEAAKTAKSDAVYHACCVEPAPSSGRLAAAAAALVAAETAANRASWEVRDGRRRNLPRAVGLRLLATEEAARTTLAAAKAEREAALMVVSGETRAAHDAVEAEHDPMVKVASAALEATPEHAAVLSAQGAESDAYAAVWSTRAAYAETPEGREADAWAAEKRTAREREAGRRANDDAEYATYGWRGRMD